MLIEQLAGEGSRLFDLVDGGFGKRNDTLLGRVCALAVAQTGVRGTSLLRLIRETDARGLAAETRRLLLCLPDAYLIGLAAADVATIVTLSRRYQLSGIVGECTDLSLLGAEVLERLGVEDVAWLIEHEELSDESRAHLQDLLRTTGRYDRMLRAGWVVTGVYPI